MVATRRQPTTLSAEAVARYEADGYLRLPGVFSPAETQELSVQLDEVISRFAVADRGWTGPWREKYLSKQEDAKSTLPPSTAWGFMRRPGRARS